MILGIFWVGFGSYLFFIQAFFFAVSCREGIIFAFLAVWIQIPNGLETCHPWRLTWWTGKSTPGKGDSIWKIIVYINQFRLHVKLWGWCRWWFSHHSVEKYELSRNHQTSFEVKNGNHLKNWWDDINLLQFSGDKHALQCSLFSFFEKEDFWGGMNTSGVPAWFLKVVTFWEFCWDFDMFSCWRVQPIWKILVNLEIFPK